MTAHGCKRILPDRDTCPCCGEFMTYLNKDGVTRFINENAEAICAEQYYDQDNSLEDYSFMWRCRTCGCAWKHGQADVPETKVPQ